ncbi:jg212, partial [Pararge aegeria aegeria]
DLTYKVNDKNYIGIKPEFIAYDHVRERRDVDNASVPAAPATTNASNSGASSITSTTVPTQTINTSGASCYVYASTRSKNGLNAAASLQPPGRVYIDLCGCTFRLLSIDC